MVPSEKIIEEFDITDFEIETDDGWKPVTKAIKTVPYQIYTIKTENYELSGADTHIIFTKNYKEIFIKDLKIGTEIYTKTGLEEITSLGISSQFENMYDFSVDSNDHRYYTNGILSHNTTCSCIYLLWKALFNNHKTYAILGNKDKTATGILKDLKIAYEKIPEWLKPGCTVYNEHTMSFDNGTTIFSSATSKDALRGESISTLLLDEFSHVRPNVADEFWTANYPTISTGGDIIIVSTPNGVSNLFHEIWTKSMLGENSFAPLRVDWWEVPGRDSEWRDKTIDDIGIIRFNQEYGNNFLGSQHTLIDTKLLEELSFKDPIAGDGIHYNVYEHKKDDALYVMGIDVAAGTKHDYSVIQIGRVLTKDTIKQVAVWRRNDTDIFDFAKAINELALYWNEAYINIENNGGFGSAVVHRLWNEYEYTNIFKDMPDSTSSKKKKKVALGTNANSYTKKSMVSILKRHLEHKTIEVVDRNTISELSSFIDHGKERFSASAGAKDDTIMSLGWLLYMVESVWFQDILDWEGYQTSSELKILNDINNREDVSEKQGPPDPGTFLFSDDDSGGF